MIAWALSCDRMVVVDGGSIPISFGVLWSTLFSLVLERYFWLLNYEIVYSFIAK
jgi:hypothetical protein